MKKSILEGFAAGIFIGIGGAVYLSCENKVIGAILFSVALLSICLLSLQLFTGKVGMIVLSHTKADWVSLCGCLIGNLLGTLAASLIVDCARPMLRETASVLVDNKLANNAVPAVFCAAILCGILMYTAVACYKQKNTIAAICFCVPVFILSGFEHSIADMFYFFLAQSFTLESWVFLGIVVLGNSVGGMLIPALTTLANK